MSPRVASTSQTIHIVSPDQDSFPQGGSDRGHLHQLNIHMMMSDRNKYWSTNRRVQLQCVSVKRRLIVNVSGGGDDGREQRGKLGKGGCNHEVTSKRCPECHKPLLFRFEFGPQASRRGCSAAMQRTRYKAASS